MMKFILKMPIGFVASVLGSVTLSNAYAGTFEMLWVRHVLSICGIIVVLMMLVKIAKTHSEFIGVYRSNPVLASLYPAFSMLILASGRYLSTYHFAIGKYIWMFGLVLHAFFIIMFTYRNVIRNFDYNVFIPTWFVTYFGILVAAVVGKPFGFDNIMYALGYYGFFAFIVVYLPLLTRVYKDGLPENFAQTRAICLAPPSLVLVTYLNHFDVNPTIAMVIYTILTLVFLEMWLNVPKFFAVSFTPAFAGLTFPLAIATVAGFTYSDYLASINEMTLANIVFQFTGFVLITATVFIAIVIFNFLKTLLAKEA